MEAMGWPCGCYCNGNADMGTSSGVYHYINYLTIIAARNASGTSVIDQLGITPPAQNNESGELVPPSGDLLPPS